MFFSASLVEELVLSLATEQTLDTDDVQNFIYHLKLPGDAVSAFTAQVIAEEPTIGRCPNHFPGRLAYGILDDALLRLDLAVRYEHQSRLCRKVAKIQLELQKLEHPISVIRAFDTLLALLVFACSSARDLGARENEPLKTELAIMVEQIIEALLRQNDLSKRLLERVVGQMRRAEKNRLEARVSETIKEGLDNPPWDDSAPIVGLVEVNQPVRFRQSLCADENFSDAVWDAIEHITSLCRAH